MLDQFQAAELQENSWTRLQIIAAQAAEYEKDSQAAIQKYGQALGAKDLGIKTEAYHRRAKVFERVNIDEALAHYNEGIDLLEKSPFTNRLRLLQMYIDRAWIFIEQRPDLDKAAATLRRADTLIDRRHLPEWADLHNCWGELFQYKKKFKDAIKYRFRAWLAAQELKDVQGMIKFAHNLGVDYTKNTGPDHPFAQVAIERSPYSTCHSDFGQNLAPTLRDSDQSRNDKCAKG